MKKKINMTWLQAKKKYPKLKPFGDADGDGVKNKFDCRPFNKRKQDEPPKEEEKPRKEDSDEIKNFDIHEKNTIFRNDKYGRFR